MTIARLPKGKPTLAQHEIGRARALHLEFSSYMRVYASESALIQYLNIFADVRHSHTALQAQLTISPAAAQGIISYAYKFDPTNILIYGDMAPEEVLAFVAGMRAGNRMKGETFARVEQINTELKSLRVKLENEQC